MPLGLIRVPRQRRVFFSFHYQRDNWSVGQIRNSWLANPYHVAQPFYDHAAWEQIKRRGEAAIKRWIDEQLNGSSVTVVLVGPETMGRRWVKYEIDESLRLRKGLLAVTLEGIRQRNGAPDLWNNYTAYGPFIHGQQTHAVYSWNGDNGRANLAGWIELAARQAGR
jgi:hypothetical protein